MSPELALAGVLLISLTVYALLAGADFGAGVLSLLAAGRHGGAQRDAIAKSIAPIWEANHVWLILAVTVLFTAFPPAFAAVMTTLHIPIVAMLIGIVLRGSAFAFRHYDVSPGEAPVGPRRLWELIFGVSSVATPVCLGITVGAVAAGLEPAGPGFWNRFVAPWLDPFPIAVGAMAVTLFTMLAALYLCVDARGAALQEQFRRRALGAAGAAAVAAAVAFALAPRHAERITERLLDTAWGDLLLAATVAAAAGTVAALLVRTYRLAVFFGVSEVCAILWGWGLSQYPYLVEPNLTIFNAAAPRATLALLLYLLVAGAVVLFPSLLYLYKIFKSHLLTS
ncbi:MAG TPA: cytochrome d ubiquinol oxidase subunit II [Nitrospirales bacterium]|nr:cytochrome d ubiquinol oxidase subunit II [Nitrospirales bacterium]